MPRTELSTEEYLKKAEDKVRGLLVKYPELIDNPKNLIREYWIRYDKLIIWGNWKDSTSPETITRVLRKLTSGPTREFTKRKDAELERRTKQEEYSKIFKR